MTIAYFLELSAQNTGPDRFGETLTADLNDRLRRLPALQCIDIFTPQPAHDPLLDDGAGPLLVLQLRLADQQRLADLLASSQLRQLTEILQQQSLDDAALVQEALKIEKYQVAQGGAVPGQISYLVNYRRPAADEPAFLDYYRAHHPPIMRGFAGLRSLELGLPIGWCPPAGIALADRMLFCDVSFDSIAALDAALASDVRKELRADFERFPPFSGRVSHYAMQRRRLQPHSV